MHLFQQHAPADADAAIAQIPIIDFGPYFAGTPGALAPLAEAVRAGGGGEPLHLASGAGHDGTAMAKLCPIAMMFVRCRGGISHNPAEHATAADIEVAARVLLSLIDAYAREHRGR